MVCKPKEEGRLGILDLKKQNEALPMKNLDKFLNRKYIPWVSLIWEKHYGNKKPPSHIKKAPFGGEMSLSFWILLNLSPLSLFKMVKPVSFGKILGCNSLFTCNILNYTLLLRIS
jgi:hypothetical protein